MEKTSLNIRHLCLVMAALFFLTTTSCTKDTADESLYEQQSKKKKNKPVEKPWIDRMDVQTEPERG